MRTLLAALLFVSTGAFAIDMPKEACQKDFKTICPDKLPTKANIKECLEGHHDKLTPECAKEFDAMKNLQGKKEEKKVDHKAEVKAKAKAKGDEVKKDFQNLLK